MLDDAHRILPDSRACDEEAANNDYIAASREIPGHELVSNYLCAITQRLCVLKQLQSMLATAIPRENLGREIEAASRNPDYTSAPNTQADRH